MAKRSKKGHDTTLAQIAWKDFGKVRAKQSVITRVKSMKRCHGTIATLSQLRKMFPEKYDKVTCPCCKSHEETNDHLWACPNEEMDLIVTNGPLLPFIVSASAEGQRLIIASIKPKYNTLGSVFYSLYDPLFNRRLELD
jgi:hypothetical protein